MCLSENGVGVRSWFGPPLEFPPRRGLDRVPIRSDELVRRQPCCTCNGFDEYMEGSIGAEQESVSTALLARLRIGLSDVVDRRCTPSSRAPTLVPRLRLGQPARYCHAPMHRIVGGEDAAGGHRQPSPILAGRVRKCSPSGQVTVSWTGSGSEVWGAHTVQWNVSASAALQLRRWSKVLARCLGSVRPTRAPARSADNPRLRRMFPRVRCA